MKNNQIQPKKAKTKKKLFMCSLVYKICEKNKMPKLKISKKFTLHVQLARANRN